MTNGARKSQRRRKPSAVAAYALASLSQEGESAMENSSALARSGAIKSAKDTSANTRISLGRGGARGANSKLKNKTATKRKRKAVTAARKREKADVYHSASALLPLGDHGGGSHSHSHSRPGPGPAVVGLVAEPVDTFCPVIMGRPVTGGSGGVRFQLMGNSGGLAYRGKCRPHRVSNRIEPSGEVSVSQSHNSGTFTPPRTSAAAGRSCKTPPPNGQRPQMNSAWTPRALSFLTMSPNTAHWGGYNGAVEPVTPHANITRGVLRTPTSMPAVNTPTRLTQSAKRFHDALVESSPLALLASAADMKSNNQTRIDGYSNDVTPSPADGPNGTNSSSWASTTPTIPIPTFSGRESPDSELESPHENADGIKASAIFKRYNIRPKEKSRVVSDGPGGGPTPVSLMSDLLYEKPSEQRQPPSLLVSSTPHHRPTDSVTSADLAQGAAALTAVMTGKVKS